MMTATCGHKIEDGITCSVDEGQLMSNGSPAITYGSYCSKCMFEYFLAGEIENKEMSEFIDLIIKWAEA